MAQLFQSSLQDPKVAMREMLDQAMIALVKKNGGKVELTVEEIDNTSQDLLTVQLDLMTRIFTFAIKNKN